jgi:hypothetical protein
MTSRHEEKEKKKGLTRKERTENEKGNNWSEERRLRETRAAV